MLNSRASHGYQQENDDEGGTSPRFKTQHFNSRTGSSSTDEDEDNDTMGELFNDNRTVITTRTTKTARTITTIKGREMDQLFDSLLDDDADAGGDDLADDDCTEMSDMVPILTSEMIRTSAPRLVVTSVDSDGDDHDDEDFRRKVQDVGAGQAAASDLNRILEVEPVCPPTVIDSSSRADSCQQQAHFSSKSRTSQGTESRTTSTPPSSGSRRRWTEVRSRRNNNRNRVSLLSRDTNASSSSTESSSASGGTSSGATSILEAMGLRPPKGSEKGGGGGELDSYLERHGRKSSTTSSHRNFGKQSRRNSLTSSTTTTSASTRFMRGREQALKYRNRVIHSNTVVMMLFLVSVAFAAVQFTTFARHNIDFTAKYQQGKEGGSSVGFEDGEVTGRKLVPLLGSFGNAQKTLSSSSNKMSSSNLRQEHNRNNVVITSGRMTMAVDGGGVGDVPLNQEKLSADLSKVSKLLPESYQFLSDINSSDELKMDTPLFWNIPRSGGSIVKEIISTCQKMVVASEVGERDGHQSDTELKRIRLYGHTYVNVDTSTPQGISRAKSLGLGSSNSADVIISPQIHLASTLFDPTHKARAFALFRHPVERAVSIFYQLKEHHSSNEEFTTMSLEQYAKSPHAENNWMVRFLSGRLEGEVTIEHLAVAKEVVRTKFVVGLLEEKDESIRRFEDYFGWTYGGVNRKRQMRCREKILRGNKQTNESSKTKIKEGSQAWSLIEWQNNLDIKLYQYAKFLFVQQGKELFDSRHQSSV